MNWYGCSNFWHDCRLSRSVAETSRRAVLFKARARRNVRWRVLCCCMFLVYKLYSHCISVCRDPRFNPTWLTLIKSLRDKLKTGELPVTFMDTTVSVVVIDAVLVTYYCSIHRGSYGRADQEYGLFRQMCRIVGVSSDSQEDLEN